jgi:threonine dehydrogenase-like Zn-dependent dehydrogenase
MNRPYEVAIREFERPTIGPDAALIQVQMAGICGSDPKPFRGELSMKACPHCGESLAREMDPVLGNQPGCFEKLARSFSAV